MYNEWSIIMPEVHHTYWCTSLHSSYSPMFFTSTPLHSPSCSLSPTCIARGRSTGMLWSQLALYGPQSLGFFPPHSPSVPLLSGNNTESIETILKVTVFRQVLHSRHGRSTSASGNGCRVLSPSNYSWHGLLEPLQQLFPKWLAQLKLSGSNCNDITMSPQLLPKSWRLWWSEWQDDWHVLEWHADLLCHCCSFFSLIQWVGEGEELMETNQVDRDGSPQTNAAWSRATEPIRFGFIITL